MHTNKHGCVTLWGVTDVHIPLDIANIYFTAALGPMKMSNRWAHVLNVSPLSLYIWCPITSLPAKATLLWQMMGWRRKDGTVPRRSGADWGWGWGRLLGFRKFHCAVVIDLTLLAASEGRSVFICYLTALRSRVRRLNFFFSLCYFCFKWMWSWISQYVLVCIGKCVWIMITTL